MFQISGRTIGKDYPPYIIAELSANHGGSLDVAKQAIKLAKENGADAIKIQTYTPDTMTIQSDKPGFQINKGLWKGHTLYDLYKQAYTPFEWHSELFECAAAHGITIFSSPFDDSAVDLLEGLDAPAYKIASFELVDLPLIRRVAECDRPVLISTGMATLEEVREALETVLRYGCGEVLLFHCISSYPAPITDFNLRSLEVLRDEFGVEVGLSDHSLSNLAATLSISLGATAIEKHFKPSDSVNAADASFSITPEQLKSLVSDCYDAWKSLGSKKFKRSISENQMRNYRRSIYFMSDLRAGDVIQRQDVRIIRPGFGLAPRNIEFVIGSTVCKDVVRGDPVTEDVLSE